MSVWGLVAEFETPEAVVAAARSAREAGYRRVEAYTPWPIEGLAEALGQERTRLPLVVLLGGIAGAAIGFGMQAWSAVFDYPHDVGGRPPFSWPAFMPITFELMVLGAALAGLLGTLLACRLPRLHHPIFDAPRFELASRDRFFLSVEAEDPRFDRDATERFLRSLGPAGVHEVPA